MTLRQLIALIEPTPSLLPSDPYEDEMARAHANAWVEVDRRLTVLEAQIVSIQMSLPRGIPKLDDPPTAHAAPGPKRPRKAGTTRRAPRAPVTTPKTRA